MTTDAQIQKDMKRFYADMPEFERWLENQPNLQEELNALPEERRDWRKDGMYHEWKKGRREEPKELDIWQDLPGGKRKFLTQNAAHNIMIKHRFVTLGENKHEMYYYLNGVYRSGGANLISSLVEAMTEGEISRRQVNEVIGHIERRTYKALEEVKEPAEQICLANGILHIGRRQVTPHTPDTIFFNKIPVSYEPEEDCLQIKKFLSQVVGRDDLVLLQECTGYCLLKAYPFHKAFMLVGTGANGKSTFINLLKSLLGPENCSSIALQQLEADRFAISSLHGKLANLFADLPSSALKQTSYFKMLTGEDLISAQKKFKDCFSFENYAKLIFSANQVPKSPDDTDAFFRRWIIIIFPNQFLEGKADPNLADKLKAELSGFLNFALAGLERLQNQGHFSTTQSLERVREEYIRKSDSVAAFLIDKIDTDPEAYIPKKLLYSAYLDYCREQRYPVLADTSFAKHLKKSDQANVSDYRPIEGKGRVNAWRGIKFRDLIENNPDSPDNQTKLVNDVKAVKAEPFLNRSKESSISIKKRMNLDNPDNLGQEGIHHKCIKCGASPCFTQTQRGDYLCKKCTEEYVA